MVWWGRGQKDKESEGKEQRCKDLFIPSWRLVVADGHVRKVLILHLGNHRMTVLHWLKDGRALVHVHLGKPHLHSPWPFGPQDVRLVEDHTHLHEIARVRRARVKDEGRMKSQRSNAALGKWSHERLIKVDLI